MKILYIKQDGDEELPELVATIGFFDGVHRGHQFLISRVRDEAERSGMASAVITFDRHPRQVLQADYQPQLLSTLGEKLLLLSKTGVDNTIVLHFDAALAALPARAFMEEVLCRRLNVKKLVIGYDNRFGHNRSEGFEHYVQYGRELGIEVVQADAFLAAFQKVLVENIAKGEAVKITGLMGVERVERAARTGRNPRTGEEIQIPAGYGVKLTVGSALKKAVAK